ncbi:MAG: recombinase family protein [Nocardioides sp.]
MAFGCRLGWLRGPGCAGCQLIWTEKASGVAADRPELADLLHQAHAGDTIVVWRLDRLARSTRHLLELVDDLRERGIGLVTLHERLDTTSSTGQFIFTVFAALAELQRDLIRDRTRAGLAAAQAQGRRGGRPSLVTSERQQAINTLTSDGLTVAQIAPAVGVSRATICRHRPS